MIDEELFFARRLGYGLRHDESIGQDVKTWAVDQISAVPELDFYGLDGTSIRHQFHQDYVDPITDIREATRLFGFYANRERELQALAGSVDEATLRRQLEDEIYNPRGNHADWRDCLVRSLTATGGPSPVFERFWTFWVNHFTVNAEPFTKPLYGTHTRAIRNRMTGQFKGMLRDAILNPAMLRFLDNYLSTGPNSENGIHSRDTINENLAREVLELHTMSPAGGYTQQDVVEMSYVLSGWSIYSGESQAAWIRGNPYGAHFGHRRHEPGVRTVLGNSYSDRNRGMNQASLVLDDLAVDPKTAEYLSWKLVRHFVADVPPPDSVARVRDVWMDTGGDLVQVHTAVIDEVLLKALDNPKFTTPETWLYQAHRMIEVDIPTTEIWGNGMWITAICDELGQSYNECPQPNGWSDLEEDWVSRELVERRVRYAHTLARNFRTNAVLEKAHNLATRLGGSSSDLVAAIDASEDRREAVTVLLSSPQFLRI